MSVVHPQSTGLPALVPIIPEQNGIGADDSLYEIVRGSRVELPPMSYLSVWIASCLHGLLWPYVKKNKLGMAITEALFIVDVKNDIRRRPDVAFVSAQTWP